MRKGHKPEGCENRVPLIPTKAALFGLDIRFRSIDEQIAKKKIKRGRAQSLNINAQDGVFHNPNQNRHLFPSEEMI